MAPDHDAFLRSHRWALLATTRRDGSPQVSMVAYHYDGADLVVSCRGSSAKAGNARRVPRVVLSVPDDRRYLAVSGPCDVVDAGAELTALTLRVQGALEERDANVLQGEIDAGLEVVGRVVLRVQPAQVLGRI